MKMSLGILAGTLLLFGQASAVPLHARHYTNDDPWSGSYAGSLYDLPVGTDPQTAVHHALGMPQVQAAVDACLARGYVRVAERDSAVCLRNPPLTVVVLAFNKPGLVPPAGMIGAPVVHVSTVLDPTGLPATQISGGLVFVETQTGTLHTAADVPGYNEDGSFDMGGGGGGGSMRRPDQIVACFDNYVMCAGVGNSACVVSAMLPAVPVWSVVRALSCVSFTTISCLYQFGNCMR